MKYLYLMGLVALVILAGCQKQPQQTGMDETQKTKGGTAAASTDPKSEGAAAEGKWLTSLDEGMKLARQQSKPLVVDFFATWCGPCRMLDEQTWPDPQVKQALADYVAVRLDTDKNQDLARKYEITGIPAIIFMDSAGSEKRRQVGFVSPQEMVKLLKANK